MKRNFWKMINSQRSEGRHVCLELTGQPPVWDNRCLVPRRDAIWSFNRQIIEATLGLVTAYHIRISSYLQRGLLEGGAALHTVLTYALERAPTIPIILDGMSAQFTTADLITLFVQMSADGVIVHPQDDSDVLRELLGQQGKGIFLIDSRTGREVVQEQLSGNGVGLYDKPEKAKESCFSYSRRGVLSIVMQGASVVSLSQDFARSKTLPEQRTPELFVSYVKNVLGQRNTELSQQSTYSSALEFGEE